ncbi:MAG: hypothetical protein PVF15_03365 [Candidatus Bathyarchaeota archaeon]
MQRRWVGKNVNLALLSSYIENFFKIRGLETGKEESEGKYTIRWAPPRVNNKRGTMKVTIVGDADDFSVEFIASERTRRSIRLGSLTTQFGGGYLLLRGLRLREALEKLEREFWAYVEDKIAHLIRFAESDTKTSQT